MNQNDINQFKPKKNWIIFDNISYILVSQNNFDTLANIWCDKLHELSSSKNKLHVKKRRRLIMMRNQILILARWKEKQLCRWTMKFYVTNQFKYKLYICT